MLESNHISIDDFSWDSIGAVRVGSLPHLVILKGSLKGASVGPGVYAVRTVLASFFKVAVENISVAVTVNTYVIYTGTSSVLFVV